MFEMQSSTLTGRWWLFAPPINSLSLYSRGSCISVLFRENGCNLTLPCAIFVAAVKTLPDALESGINLRQTLSILLSLAKVLSSFHQRGWYLRDVTFENVVYVRMGDTEGWTLLEFGNASRPKSRFSKDTINGRQCPPEV